MEVLKPDLSALSHADLLRVANLLFLHAATPSIVFLQQQYLREIWQILQKNGYPTANDPSLCS